mmetsp:Transcript_56663/g.124250  ORF Transcript_56663/g.124250 Transcript_56663/m.124250 type:complete len:460 (+) Transcript_56663:48-1427(+)
MRCSLPLIALPIAVGQSDGCTITTKMCPKFPELEGAQFRDTMGERFFRAGEVDVACLKRAEEMHQWCGNSPSSVAVAATYNPSQVTQVYNPGACDPGWSLLGKHCFKHFLSKKNWYEAEVFCKTQGDGAHLASIHSKMENEFVFVLTQGLSAWIGFQDMDQDQTFEWTDASKSDFTYWALNCTGREHEPECQPQEVAQQWYDWEGADEGTFLCKMPAKLPVDVIKNLPADQVFEFEWEAATRSGAAEEEMTEEELRREAMLAKAQITAVVFSDTLPITPRFFGPVPPQHLANATANCTLETAIAQAEAYRLEIEQLRAEAKARRNRESLLEKKVAAYQKLLKRHEQLAAEQAEKLAAAQEALAEKERELEAALKKGSKAETLARALAKMVHEMKGDRAALQDQLRAQREALEEEKREQEEDIDRLREDAEAYSKMSSQDDSDASCEEPPSPWAGRGVQG